MSIIVLFDNGICNLSQSTPLLRHRRSSSIRIVMVDATRPVNDSYYFWIKYYFIKIKTMDTRSLLTTAATPSVHSKLPSYKFVDPTDIPLPLPNVIPPNLHYKPNRHKCVHPLILIDIDIDPSLSYLSASKVFSFILPLPSPWPRALFPLKARESCQFQIIV